MAATGQFSGCEGDGVDDVLDSSSGDREKFPRSSGSAEERLAEAPPHVNWRSTFYCCSTPEGCNER